MNNLFACHWYISLNVFVTHTHVFCMASSGKSRRINDQTCSRWPCHRIVSSDTRIGTLKQNRLYHWLQLCWQYMPINAASKSWIWWINLWQIPSSWLMLPYFHCICVLLPNARHGIPFDQLRRNRATQRCSDLTQVGTNQPMCWSED